MGPHKVCKFMCTVGKVLVCKCVSTIEVLICRCVSKVGKVLVCDSTIRSIGKSTGYEVLVYKCMSTIGIV